MARIGAFKIDSKAIETGEWQRLGEEFDDAEVLVRGFTDAYTNAHAAKLRQAAKPFNGDTSKLPIEVSRALLIESVLKHLVLDVRKIQNLDGSDTTLAQFADYLRDPDYALLLNATLTAIGRVGLTKAAVADAAGNSPVISA